MLKYVVKPILCTIKPINTLSFDIENDNKLQLSFQINEKYAQIHHDEYRGSYIIDPLFTQQILGTKDRVCVDDITVKAIAYREEENAAGGLTAYIGGGI